MNQKNITQPTSLSVFFIIGILIALAIIVLLPQEIWVNLSMRFFK